MREVWVWLHAPMGWGLMTLEKVLAREILDGTDTRRRDIVKVVKIGEQWHQNTRDRYY